MSLLVIGLTLVLAHLLGRHWRRWRQQLIRSWYAGVLRKLQGTAWSGGIAVVLIVAIPVLLVGLAQYALTSAGSTLGWLALSLLVMAFSWGLRDLDRDVESYLEAESDTVRDRAARTLIYSRPQSQSQGKGELGCVIRGIFHESLVRWFGVIFWFLVLGPAGALLFRLTHAGLVDAGSRALLSPAQHSTLLRVAALLDIPPALLGALSMAIVGDYDSVVAAWRRETRREDRGLSHWGYGFFPEVGYATVMRGEEVEKAFDHDYDGGLAKVNHAMSLVWRSLVCWMTVLAILILMGVVS